MQGNWEEPATGGSDDLRRFFEENLALINQISAQICRRNSCFGPEAEDFTSQVRLKFLENDFARLRKFGGRSSLRTYLTTVIANLFRDDRIQKWGKFRPSQVAKREGAVARHLETLVFRDGRPLDEAMRILRQNYKVEQTEAQLLEIATKLPPRLPRLREGEEQLEQIPTDGGVEARVMGRERAVLAFAVKKALAEGLQELAPEDRLILRMRFEDSFTVAKIAQTLRLEQRPLYSRIDRCRKHLRAHLEQKGLSSGDALSLVGWDDQDDED